MFVPVNFKSPLLYNNLPKDFYILFFTFAAVIGFRFLSWYMITEKSQKYYIYWKTSVVLLLFIVLLMLIHWGISII